MSRRKPITQRFKGHWILRAAVWEPQEYRGKLDYFKLVAEYALPPRVGRFLQCLLLYWNEIDGPFLEELERLGKTLEQKNRDSVTVKDVMSS